MMYKQGTMLLAAAFLVVALSLLYIVGSDTFSIQYDNGDSDNESLDTGTVLDESEEAEPAVAHLPPPDDFKAIYMSQCVAGTPDFRERLARLIEETELNAVVIDVKDFSGKIGFPTDNPVLAESVSDECGAYDLKDFIKELHGKGIYVVARITVFQDPHYTMVNPESAVKRASDGEVWQDYKDLSFVDVGYEPFWDYIVELSRESYALGFDELNYDYIRYPSDGNLHDVAFTHTKEKTRADAVEDFFAYLYEEMSDTDAVLSADLFGYTTTNLDDLGIGQVIERALPYFHYVMPMVYPSHYNPGFIGFQDPAAHPYDVVKYSMESAVRRARKIELAKDSTATSTEVVALKEIAEKGHGNISPDQLRPWLQDFDLGATYTPEMVRAQIQATYDAGLDSWALWDAGNTYTREALESSSGDVEKPE